MRNTHRLILGLLAGAALTAALAACGGSDKKDSAASSTGTAAPQAGSSSSSSGDPYDYGSGSSTAAATPAPSAASSTAQAVEVKATSPDFAFEPKEIAVKPGAVVVTLVNNSAQRPHNFAVKKLSGDGDLAKSADAASNGGTATVEFTVTDKGTYQFYCTLPGHADRGQKGTLTVS